jgi:hypothetical protein
MHTIGNEKDMFIGLGWEINIKCLIDIHVPYNPLPKRDRNVAKQYGDDYKITSFYSLHTRRKLVHYNRPLRLGRCDLAIATHPRKMHKKYQYDFQLEYFS